MNAELKKSPCCSLCGASRKPSELNGSMLINGSWDYSSAYCSRIAECDSKDAISKIDDLLEDLSGPSSTSDTSDSIVLYSLVADSYSKAQLIGFFIEQLEIIESQAEDENIRVKLHFGLVCKASGLVELFQCLYPSIPVPGRIIELSNSISESYFS